MEIEPSTTAVRSPRSYAWISTTDLKPGMVIARPVFGRSGMRLTIHLAVGSAITASTISQLVNKGVECVAIVQDTNLDETTYAKLVSQHESRLHEIFGHDPDEDCSPLLDALLADGPFQC